MAKKIMISDKQLKDTLSVQLINCSGFVNTLYKYMPASRVLDILENKSHLLGFVSPESWYDPYETKYLNTDYTALNGYIQPKIYCFCTRMDNLNEEASWKIYKKENDPLMRMSIRTIDFLFSINEFAKKYDCDVYFSKVDYSLMKKDIDFLHLPSSSYYNEFFDNLDDKKYVRIMSLKRRAFNYENEYRIFIIPRNQDKIAPHIKNDVLLIPVSIKMIKQFTFYPSNKTDNNLISQIEMAKYEGEYKFVKNRIKAVYPEANVVKSTLYSSVKKVEKISLVAH